MDPIDPARPEPVFLETPHPEDRSAPPEVATFAKVFGDECHDIEIRRRALRGVGTVPGLITDAPTVRNGFAGLALSGGGIRSAAFCLGALQGLGSRDLIGRFDYLSTVSGGGYIGTTLSIGLSEGSGFPFGLGGTEAGETATTRHIRDNARYLIPNGVISLGTALAVYLRGLAMNLLVVLPVLLASAAILIACNPVTRDLDRASWAGGVLGAAPDRFNPPLTIGALLVGVVTSMLYAVAVSLFRVPRQTRRDAVALVFAVILFVLFLGPLLEAHVLLLKGFYLPVEAAVRAPAPEGGAFETALGWLTRLVALLAPVAALPFVRRIAEQAVTEATGSWGTLLRILASRGLLLLLAAAAPAILWLCMMQLAFWGTAVSYCQVTPLVVGACPPEEIAAYWSLAPGVLARCFASGQAILGTSSVLGLDRFAAPFVYLLAAGAILLLWNVLSVNANSLHQLYRDRLGQTFLVKETRAGDGPGQGPEIAHADGHCLSDLKAAGGPYHLFNAALNVPGSAYANKRGRNADFFVFSRRHVGSDLTGYVATTRAEEVVDRLTTGTAMAISGAAAAPNMGMASVQPLSPTIALFNIRLGRWFTHPCRIAEIAADLADKQARRARRSPSRAPRGRDDAKEKRPLLVAMPGPRYLFREAFNKSGRGVGRTTDTPYADQEFVFLTDGGHIENLGIYQLLKRRCRVIVAIDGEADPDLKFSSLTQLERFARIDLGTRIVMDWRAIGEVTRGTSQGVRDRSIAPQPGPHVALGRIDYPPAGGGTEREAGVLIYVKASLSGDEADYVLAYKARNPSFPHESTADQFFSEEQFEVYRALGEHIMRRFLEGSDKAACDPDDRDALLRMAMQILPVL